MKKLIILKILNFKPFLNTNLTVKAIHTKNDSFQITLTQVDDEVHTTTITTVADDIVWITFRATDER